MAGSKTTGRPAARRAPAVSFREIAPVPIVLVTGAEDYFAGQAQTLLRRTLLAEDPELEVTELEAAEYGAGELATFVSPSLFMEPRLVLVHGAEKMSDAFLEEALAYLEQPVEGTTMLIRHRQGVRGKRLLDAIRKAPEGTTLEVRCEPLKPGELMEFVMAEFRAERRTIVPGAAAQLVAAFNADLAELAGACRQLMSVSDDLVTEQLVEDYYGGRVETTGFKIADAALAGRVGDAIALARHGFATGVSPVPVVAAVAMKLRLMAKVQGLAGSDAQLAKAAGGAPWQVGQARRDLRGWDDRMLGRAIELVAETDHRVKGAARDPEFAVERMLRRLAARDV